MSIFQLGKSIFNKRIADRKAAAHALPRIDSGLPQGIRIGSLLEISRASFAVLDGSLLKTPDDAQEPVASIGRVRLDSNTKLEIYRLYTNKGARQSDAGQTFLQIFCQGDEVVEATYYQQLFRIIPTSKEEQEAYTGNGFGLGERWYNLGRDQLEMCGLSPAQISLLLPGDDEDSSLLYERDMPTDLDYVVPPTGVENRLDDPTGMKGMRQRMHFMPYVRELPGGERENLLISFEVVESVDGSRAPEVHVDFLVGLTLDKLKYKFI